MRHTRQCSCLCNPCAKNNMTSLCGHKKPKDHQCCKAKKKISKCAIRLQPHTITIQKIFNTVKFCRKHILRKNLGWCNMAPSMHPFPFVMQLHKVAALDMADWRIEQSYVVCKVTRWSRELNKVRTEDIHTQGLSLCISTLVSVRCCPRKAATPPHFLEHSPHYTFLFAQPFHYLVSPLKKMKTGGKETVKCHSNMPTHCTEGLYPTPLNNNHCEENSLTNVRNNTMAFEAPVVVTCTAKPSLDLCPENILNMFIRHIKRGQNFSPLNGVTLPKLKHPV